MSKKIMLGDDFSDVISAVGGYVKPNGIVLAKATGKFHKDDSTYIEVIISGKSFYAKPCMSFGSVSLPSKKWLDKYKDKVHVWVAFENENSAHAIYLGVCPMDETTYPIPHEDGGGWFSTEFIEYFDDKYGVYKLGKKDNDDKFRNGIKITDDSVVLGTDGKSEGILLGESFVSDVKSILNKLLNDELVVTGSTAKHNPVTIVELTKKIAELEKHISKTTKTT